MYLVIYCSFFSNYVLMTLAMLIGAGGAMVHAQFW